MNRNRLKSSTKKVQVDQNKRSFSNTPRLSGSTLLTAGLSSLSRTNPSSSQPTLTKRQAYSSNAFRSSTPQLNNYKVLVPVKRVTDFAVRVRVAADKYGVDLKGVKMSINPFCQIATEEAVRMKEKKTASEVIALTIGPKASQEILRTTLAMGADKAIHIETDLRTDTDLQPLHVAKLIAKIAEREKADLVLTGKQSIDDDFNATGQMVAGFLNWPQATFASKIEPTDGNKLRVTREIDGGMETIDVSTPAVITADLRLNEPRYVTLPNIMKARKIPIETIDAKTLGIDLTPRLTTVEVNEPPKRTAGKKVSTVDELVSELTSRGVLNN